MLRTPTPRRLQLATCGPADACGNEFVASWNHQPRRIVPLYLILRISFTGAHNDSARHGRSSRGIGSSCGSVGCEPRSRTNDDAVERKAGDELHHVRSRYLRQRRSDIEFNGDGKKRHSAICRWTRQFGCADGAERRQADGSSPRLPSGFEAKIGRAIHQASKLPSDDRAWPVRSADR